MKNYKTKWAIFRLFLVTFFGVAVFFGHQQFASAATDPLAAQKADAIQRSALAKQCFDGLKFTDVANINCKIIGFPAAGVEKTYSFVDIKPVSDGTENYAPKNLATGDLLCSIAGTSFSSSSSGINLKSSILPETIGGTTSIKASFNLGIMLPNALFNTGFNTSGYGCYPYGYYEDTTRSGKILETNVSDAQNAKTWFSWDKTNNAIAGLPGVTDGGLSLASTNFTENPKWNPTKTPNIVIYQRGVNLATDTCSGELIAIQINSSGAPDQPTKAKEFSLDSSYPTKLTAATFPELGWFDSTVIGASLCGVKANYGSGSSDWFSINKEPPTAEQIKTATGSLTGTPSGGIPGTSACGTLPDCIAQGDQLDSSACVANSHTSLEWILCPIINSISKFADQINGYVEDQLHFRVNEMLPDCVSSAVNANNCGVNRAWSIIKNIVASMLVIIMLVMVISQAIGRGPFEAYTVKKVLPRLVIAVIAMQFSWVLTRELINIANDLGVGIKQIMLAAFGGGSNLDLGSVLHNLNPAYAAGTSVSLWAILLALIFSEALAGFILPVLLFVALAVGSALFVAMVTLVFRNVLIIMSVIFSPLALLLWVLPGQTFQGYWKKYLDNFIKLLMLFPLVMGMIYAGRIVAYLAGNIGAAGPIDYLVVLIAFFGPYFYLPKTFKWGGQILGAVNNAMATNKLLGKGYGGLRNILTSDIKDTAGGLARKLKEGRPGVELGRFKRGPLKGRRNIFNPQGNYVYGALAGHNPLSAMGRAKITKQAEENKHFGDQAGDELNKGRAEDVRTGEKNAAALTYAERGTLGGVQLDFFRSGDPGGEKGYIAALSQQGNVFDRWKRRAGMAVLRMAKDRRNIFYNSLYTLLDPKNIRYKNMKAAYDKNQRGEALNDEEKMWLTIGTNRKGEFTAKPMSQKQMDKDAELVEKLKKEHGRGDFAQNLTMPLPDGSSVPIPGLYAHRYAALDETINKITSEGVDNPGGSILDSATVAGRIIRDADVDNARTEAIRQGFTVAALGPGDPGYEDGDYGVQIRAPVAYRPGVYKIIRVQSGKRWGSASNNIYLNTDVIDSTSLAAVSEGDWQKMAADSNDLNVEQVGIAHSGKRNDMVAVAHPDTTAEIFLKTARIAAGGDPAAMASLGRSLQPSKKAKIDEELKHVAPELQVIINTVANLPVGTLITVDTFETIFKDHYGSRAAVPATDLLIDHGTTAGRWWLAGPAGTPGPMGDPGVGGGGGGGPAGGRGRDPAGVLPRPTYGAEDGGSVGGTSSAPAMEEVPDLRSMYANEPDEAPEEAPDLKAIHAEDRQSAARSSTQARELPLGNSQTPTKTVVNERNITNETVKTTQVVQEVPKINQSGEVSSGLLHGQQENTPVTGGLNLRGGTAVDQKEFAADITEAIKKGVKAGIAGGADKPGIKPEVAADKAADRVSDAIDGK